MSEPVPVNVPIEIRWRDLDALGHVNNAVYLTYFEHARLGYIRALLGEHFDVDPRTSLPRDFQFSVAEVTCHFRLPATIADRLVVSIHVSRVGHKSFVFQYRITNQVSGQLVAEGCSTQVWYDYAAGESRPVPAEVVARMEQLQGAAITPPGSRGRVTPLPPPGCAGGGRSGTVRSPGR
jgi:acyl-CoA thioester hydrolase